MKIYFLRHGQTDWNAQNKLQGQVEIPLNETGKKQAQTVKEEVDQLELDVCFVSPLSRAKETAKIVLGDREIPMMIDARIMERAYGDYEGLTYAEADAAGVHSASAIPNGETSQDVYNRVSDFLCELKEKHAEKNILVVSHGGVARSVKRYFEGAPKEGAPPHKTPNCTIVEYSTGED